MKNQSYSSAIIVSVLTPTPYLFNGVLSNTVHSIINSWDLMIVIVDVSHFQKLSEETSHDFDFNWNSEPSNIGNYDYQSELTN